MTQSLALDTSVAVPLLVEAHPDNELVSRLVTGRSIGLAGHTVAEAYSVLTRLPGDARLAPLDAARLLDTRLPLRFTLAAETASDLPAVLANLGIAGGAVYDALVALAALEHGAELATRDARARDTYERVGVRVVVAG